MLGTLKNKKDSLIARFTRSKAKARVKKTRKTKRSARSSGVKRALPVHLLWDNPAVLLLRDPRIGIGLLLLVLAVVSFPYIRAYTEFSPRRAEGEGTLDASEQWDGSSRLIMLAVGEDRISEKHRFIDALALIVVDPERQELGVFTIHPDIDVFVPELGRTVTLRTVLNLQEAKGREIEAIVRAVEVLMAVKIDRYIDTDEEGFSAFAAAFEPVPVNLAYNLEDADITDSSGRVMGWSSGGDTVYQSEFVGFLSTDQFGKDSQLARQSEFFAELIAGVDSFRTAANLPALLERFQQHVTTNLTKEEVLMLGRHVWGLRRDQIKLGYTRASSLLMTEDGSIYDRFTPVYDSIDKDISSILYNFAMAKEQARIEVYNGSGVRGMAGSRARWLTNSGGRVVQVGNARDEEVTKIYVERPERYPLTLHEIERVFGGEVIYSDSPYERKHIGDIIVVIGASVAD
ncbi:MAG: putative transcriptional regulator YvhJ [candidate division WS6 bacterium OLB20]|uniref:Putative transcriptional regulator YvhJ n=1 Tax=candidate division WS6 bacterium OLB20 TaxID=1617426 RepID=A0A136LY81_9BACT|nr:MAG: putative transcriptional regulator YvhJ [candidate division WS6 bacterium OLB20]